MMNDSARRTVGAAPRSFATLGAAAPELRGIRVPLPPPATTRAELIAAGMITPAELAKPRRFERPTLTIDLAGLGPERKHRTP